jgi:hypothetical protein
MSLFAPNYEDDIFINYSHADNDEPLDDKKRGWVDALHENLEKRLRKLTGIDPQIWRDKEKMPGNGVLPPTLAVKLQRVALLVSILSPSYLTSDWCIPELNEFYRQAAEAGKIQIDNESRIFKVIKTPIAREKHPEEVKDLPGYEFYDEYPNGMPREYSHIYGFDGYQEFWRELEHLAWDISRFVKKLSQNCDLYPRTIYLADTIADLKKEREEIKYELEMHNYCVLPDKPLPTDGPDFKEAVRGYLKRSRLSIHLIGGETGFIPAKDKRDIVYLQHDLAMERQKNSDFLRVVWTPIGLKAHDPAQQKFINYLRTRSKVQTDAELLLGNTKLASLKTYILDKLKSLEIPKRPEQHISVHPDVLALWSQPVVNEEPTSIYLIFDKKDLGSVLPLRNYLGQRYSVTWPVMDAGAKKAKQINEEHNRNMSECDAAIIFYGQANEYWVRQKLSELKKCIANGRTKPRPLSAIYIAGPINDAKKIYETTFDYQVIKNPREFSAETLKPLMDEIQKRFSQNKSREAAR